MQVNSMLICAGRKKGFFNSPFSKVKVTVHCQFSAFFFQQVRAAFEILTLLLAVLYIFILIRQMIFQEKLKTVFFDLVRVLYDNVFNKYSSAISNPRGKRKIVHCPVNPC